MCQWRDGRIPSRPLDKGRVEWRSSTAEYRYRADVQDKPPLQLRWRRAAYSLQLLVRYNVQPKWDGMGSMSLGRKDASVGLSSAQETKCHPTCGQATFKCNSSAGCGLRICALSYCCPRAARQMLSSAFRIRCRSSRRLHPSKQPAEELLPPECRDLTCIPGVGSRRRPGTCPQPETLDSVAIIHYTIAITLHVSAVGRRHACPLYRPRLCG